MRIIRNIFLCFLLIVSILIVWLNVKLYSDSFNRAERKEDIILQLNFLNHEKKSNNLADRMQNIFPEGYVFTNVLYGLAWCEIGLADTVENNKRLALQEALFAYNQINSAKAKSYFESSLYPNYGIFSLGWNNYLLSKILLLDSNCANNQNYKKLYLRNCETIVDAMKNSNSPFLQSYQYQAWPADMCVAMASLKNHEKIFDNKYQQVVADWVVNVKSKLDPRTKLISHKVNAENGKTIEGARGCSISLILRFLSEIDSNFAQEQYNLYKKNFVATTFGLPSINEYPIGLCGSGDIDSGPVIFGVGFSGTIVSIGTYSVMGDYDLAENQYKTINAFGLSKKSSEMKKYLFGQMPIADAFIAWSRTAELRNPADNIQSSNLWQLNFHILSAIILLIIWLLFYWKIIYEKLQQKLTFLKSK